LVQRSDVEADHLSIIVGIDTQVRSLNSFFNIGEQSALIGLNDDKTRFRNTNLCHLINRSWCSVIINLNALYQSRAGSPGANGREILPQGLNRLFHTPFRVFENVCCHSNAPLVTPLKKLYRTSHRGSFISWTSVPNFSPRTIASNAPA